VEKGSEEDIDRAVDEALVLSRMSRAAADGCGQAAMGSGGDVHCAGSGEGAEGVGGAVIGRSSTQMRRSVNACRRRPQSAGGVAMGRRALPRLPAPSGAQDIQILGRLLDAVPLPRPLSAGVVRPRRQEGRGGAGVQSEYLIPHAADMQAMGSPGGSGGAPSSKGGWGDGGYDGYGGGGDGGREGGARQRIMVADGGRTEGRAEGGRTRTGELQGFSWLNPDEEVVAGAPVRSPRGSVGRVMAIPSCVAGGASDAEIARLVQCLDHFDVEMVLTPLEAVAALRTLKHGKQRAESGVGGWGESGVVV
jgi:hypothetical protein